MNSLKLLLEAPLDDKTANNMLSSGKQVSIYYQGDNDSPRGWKKIEPINIEDKGGEKYLVAFEIEGLGKKPVRKSYQQSKITNWNVLGTKVAAVAAKEKEKEKKEEPKKQPIKKAPGVTQRKFTGIDEKVSDAVVNKRFVKLYYQGDEEESPGWRTDVQPVCFGSRKGVKYVRAWQESGKTTTEVPGWKFFRVDRIKNWDVDATKTFKVPPDSRFNPKGDKHLDTVFAISDFTPDTPEASPINEETMLSAIKEAINIF